VGLQVSVGLQEVTKETKGTQESRVHPEPLGYPGPLVCLGLARSFPVRKVTRVTKVTKEILARQRTSAP
jgi:hypothetical protein